MSGGSGPYSYNYAHLPLGCGDVNAPVFQCSPVAAGGYPVTVEVIDVVGNQGSASATVAVNGPHDPSSTLAMVWFTASPSAIAAGGTTSFQVVTSGGVGTLSYVYTNLPEGCATLSQPNLTCQPDAHYTKSSLTVNVTVIDGTGQAVSASTVLTIGSPGPVPTLAPTAASRLSSAEFWGLVVLISLVGASVVLARARSREPPPATPMSTYSVTLSSLHARSPPPRTGPSGPGTSWRPPSS